MAPKIEQHAITCALGISCGVRLQHVSAVIRFHGRLNLGMLKSFPEEVSDRDRVHRRWAKGLAAAGGLPLCYSLVFIGILRNLKKKLNDSNDCF